MKKTIEEHLRENIKVYFILSLILILGIIVGIIFVNNASTVHKEEIRSYLTDFIGQIKESRNINYVQLFQSSLKSNFKFIGILIFISLTIFGTIGIYILIAYKGFCLGYTISSTIAIFGVGKGTLINLSLILLNQIILIPTIFYIALSSRKLFGELINDNRENNRFEIIRYIIRIAASAVLILIAALIETYINSNIFLMIVNMI